MIVKFCIDDAVHEIQTAALADQWKGVTDRVEMYCVWRARQSAAALAFTSREMLALTHEALSCILKGQDYEDYLSYMLEDLTFYLITIEAMEGYLRCVKALASQKPQVSQTCCCKFAKEEKGAGYHGSFAYLDRTHKKHGLILGNHRKQTTQERQTKQRIHSDILSKVTTEWRLRMWHGIMIMRDGEQDKTKQGA